MHTTLTFSLFRFALFIVAGAVSQIVELSQWWTIAIFMIVLLAIYAVGYVEGQLRLVAEQADGQEPPAR